MRALKTRQLGIVLLTMATLVTMVYAALVTRQVQHQGEIVLSRDFQIYSDFECTIIVENLDWGTVSPDTTHEKIGFIKNIGSGDIIVNYTVTGLPSYITLTMGFEEGSYGSGFTNWIEGETFPIIVGEQHRIKWTITISATAPGETWTFQTEFYGWQPP